MRTKFFCDLTKWSLIPTGYVRSRNSVWFEWLCFRLRIDDTNVARFWTWKYLRLSIGHWPTDPTLPLLRIECEHKEFGLCISALGFWFQIYIYPWGEDLKPF